jgi:uncharacterized membrane-anchored protein
MRVSKDPKKTKVGGQQALATTLTNISPVGGNETDYVVTVLRPEGLIYLVFVAPEKEFGDYQRAFQDMLSSIRFTGR